MFKINTYSFSTLGLNIPPLLKVILLDVKAIPLQISFESLKSLKQWLDE